MLFELGDGDAGGGLGWTGRWQATQESGDIASSYFVFCCYAWSSIGGQKTIFRTSDFLLNAVLACLQPPLQLPRLITACEKLAWTCYSKEGWVVSFPFLWQDTDAQLQLSCLLWSTGLAHCYPVLEHFGFYTLNWPCTGARMQHQVIGPESPMASQRVWRRLRGQQRRIISLFPRCDKY